MMTGRGPHDELRLNDGRVVRRFRFGSCQKVEGDADPVFELAVDRRERGSHTHRVPSVVEADERRLLWDANVRALKNGQQ